MAAAVATRSARMGPVKQMRPGEANEVASVELVVGGDAVDPEGLTELTGIEASRGWKKGDVYSSRSGQQLARPWGIWAVTRSGADVEEVACALLRVVELQFESIRAAADIAKATITIGIWWQPPEGQGGFSLRAPLLRRLVAICERVDVYLPG